MSDMRTYVLEDDVHGEVNDPLLGRIAFDFPKGQYTPKSEEEELVIENHLVPQGFAVRADEQHLADGETPAPKVVRSHAELLADATPAETVAPVPPVTNDDDVPDGTIDDDVPDGTIDEVLAWAGDDVVRARAALEVEDEKGDNARSTLVAKLEELTQ